MTPDHSLASQGGGLRAAINHFFFDDTALSITPHGEGNINDTYLVTLNNCSQWLVQRINPHVFPHPELVMGNMRKVLDHLQREGRITGLVPERLRIFELKTGGGGRDFFVDGKGHWWRAISFIQNCGMFRTIKRPEQAEEIGAVLGCFHRLLSTLSLEGLADTLPGFHNTSKYLQSYDAVLAGVGKAFSEEERYCVEFVEHRRELPDTLSTERGELTRQVIHNDPKVANFLFSPDGERVISLVDLDTVKPGLILHDLGDALRSCCSMGREDFGESGPLFDPEFFRSFLLGYQREFGFKLTQEDRNRIVAATLLITFELGLRFFSDHLGGNVYFKIDYPGHNLKRALALFHQAARMESLRGQLDDVAAEIFFGRSR